MRQNSPISKETIAAASYDEVDGDVDMCKQRRFYLPLIENKNAEISNTIESRKRDNSNCVFPTQKEDNVKLNTANEITETILPSKRVARAIDFNPVTTSVSKPEISSYTLGSLFYAPSKPLSLSPIASFPFRQNELASPDSPLSILSNISPRIPSSFTTFSANVPVLSDPHSKSANSISVSPTYSHRRPMCFAKSADTNNNTTREARDSEVLSAYNSESAFSRIGKSPNNCNRDSSMPFILSSESASDVKDKQEILLDRNSQPESKKDINGNQELFTMPPSPFKPYTALSPAHQTISQQTLYPNIWRPVPQMAAAVQGTHVVNSIPDGKPEVHDCTPKTNTLNNVALMKTSEQVSMLTVSSTF